ncbi:MAG: hypothetical protein AAGA25_04025 [Planctomycetota bacterium]
MRKLGLSWGAMCAAVVVLNGVGCGDGADAEQTAADSDAVVETLTPEEAEALAKFRAKQAGGEVEAAPELEPEPSAVVIDANAPFPEIAQKPKAQTAPPTSGPAASAPASNAPEVSVPAPEAAAPAANAPTVFRKHQVTDPGMNGILASSMLYPETWTVEGGITRGSNMMWNNPLFLDLTFVAPDGRRLHFFPNMSFEFSSQAMQQGAQLFQPINGNLYYPLPQTPGSWLMELVQNNPDPEITNVRLVSEEVEPQLTQQLQQQAAMMYQSTQQLNQTIAQMGMGRAFDTQATVIKLHYKHNGIDIEESILMAWQAIVQTTQGQITHANWSISLMVSLGGPVGSDYMNDPELLTIVQSVRVNPQWQAAMNDYWRKLAQIKRNGQAQRDRDWQAHNAKMQKYREDTNAIIAGGYANRNQMREVGHGKQIDGIREVSPYEIGGQTVKIPDYYDNVHTDGTGRYILSNDFNYNPNRDLNMPGNWTKVDPQR